MENKLEFIIKTTFGCNLRCAYCYEGHSQQVENMSDDTLRGIINKIGHYAMDNEINITFVWHGGEPLLVGKEFYARALSLQKAVGPNFHYYNVIQTNGILLDNSFADFFVENDFKVGISIDGPPIIHDAQRFENSNGKGSFKQVYSALIAMDDRNRRPGALAVFTRNTLNHIDEFYEFFRDHEISFKINPLLRAGRAKDDATKDLQVTPKEYGEALNYLFDRWISEPSHTFSIDPFKHIVRSLVSGNNYSCTRSARCFNYFKIFPNGDVHLCGLQPYGEHCLGNFNQDDMSTIIASPERDNYSLIKAATKEACASCDHVNICHGGCTSSAFTIRQELTDRDYFCESYKTLFNHIKAIVPKQLDLCREEAMKSDFS